MGSLPPAPPGKLIVIYILLTIKKSKQTENGYIAYTRILSLSSKPFLGFRVFVDTVYIIFVNVLFVPLFLENVVHGFTRF